MKADILLIDDEDELRNAAVKILTKQGYRVSAFASPNEGLAKLASADADLLITDLMLPGMDGIEVLKRAKELRPAVEVIVLTAYAAVDKAVEAMRLGAYDFIEKPLDRTALLKAVSKALERQRRVVQDGRFQRLGGTRDLEIDFRQCHPC